MVLELGPSPAEEALSWTRFARRIVVELRAEGDVADDLLDLWARSIDQWSAQARSCQEQGLPFRLEIETEPEVAEFLLNGLDRCIHSTALHRVCTPDELARQRAFTTVVVQGFLDGLSAECSSCREYADQITASLATFLDS